MAVKFSGGRVAPAKRYRPEGDLRVPSVVSRLSPSGGRFARNRGFYPNSVMGGMGYSREPYPAIAAQRRRAYQALRPR
jgi:hypothetical protein